MVYRIQDCPGFPINGANYSFILFDVDGVLTAASRKYDIGVRVHWFRVEGTEADSCKRKHAFSKISGVDASHSADLIRRCSVLIVLYVCLYVCTVCFDWFEYFGAKNDTLIISSPTRTLNIATDSCLFQGKQLRNTSPHWCA